MLILSLGVFIKEPQSCTDFFSLSGKSALQCNAINYAFQLIKKLEQY